VEPLLHVGLSNALLATLLALLAAGAGRVCRRPALMHSLWLLVLLKLVTPPLVRVPLLWSDDIPLSPAPVDTLRGPSRNGEVVRLGSPDLPADGRPREPSGASPAVAEGQEAPPPEPPIPPEPEPFPLTWQTTTATVWLGGAALWWLVAVRRTREFNRRLRCARPAPASLRDRAGQLARRLGLRRCPAVYLVPAPVSPLLWALGWTPHVLLPAALWERLEPAQRDTLLLHELAHLRRGDHWVRRLELVVLGLYWWHPVAWWARSRLQEAEEQCCDAWVAWALPDEAPAYAAALVETVAFLSEARSALPLGASGGGSARHLKRRLNMILRGTTTRALSPAGLCAVLGLAALLLPLMPTRAEPGERPSSAPEAIPAAEPAPADKPAPRDAADPAPTAAQRPASDKPKADQVDEARDEVELLEVQFDIKKAQLEAYRLAVIQAQERLARLKKLAAVPSVSDADLNEAQKEVAKRRERLRALELMAGTAPEEARSALAALNRAEERVEELTKRRRIATVSEQEVLQAQEDLQSKEAQLRVKEAELREPELRLRQAKRRLANLQKQAAKDAPDVPSPTVQKSAEELRKLLQDLQKQADALRKVEDLHKLQELEKKLDALRKELDLLRKELQPRRPVDQPAEKPRGPVDPNAMQVNHRTFKIPFQVAAEERRVREIKLFVSRDSGRTWEQTATARPDEKEFNFSAPADGTYWFTVATVDANGLQSPSDVSTSPPGLKVVVDTKRE
jgi:beta-lactamase regulating signal transducer with metallopeptidase domain